MADLFAWPASLADALQLHLRGSLTVAVAQRVLARVQPWATKATLEEKAFMNFRPHELFIISGRQ